MRVFFTFDQRSFDAMKEMQEKAGHDRPAGIIHDALTITRAIQKLQSEGCEFIAKRPDGKEYVLCIPNLNTRQSLARKEGV